MSVKVGWSRDSGILVANVTGRIDNANSAECEEMLRSGIGDGEQALVLNLSQLSYISSAGLRILLLMAREFTGPDQAFGLCALSSGISEVIHVSGFAGIMSVYDSQAAAVEAIAASGAPPSAAALDDALAEIGP